MCDWLTPARSVDRETRIWMNNPLRFSGDTFYQSGYFRDPETGFESTTLSVVSNNSWMLPYLACMIVATGMLAHFGTVLLRFLDGRSVEPRSRNPRLIHSLPDPALHRTEWNSGCHGACRSWSCW